MNNFNIYYLKAAWTLGNLIEDNHECVVKLFEINLFKKCLQNSFIIKYKNKILLDMSFIFKICSKVKLPPGNNNIVKIKSI